MKLSSGILSRLRRSGIRLPRVFGDSGWGTDGMLMVGFRWPARFSFRVDSLRMGLNTFPRTSIGICGAWLCNCLLRFFRWLRFITYCGAGLLWALLTDLVGFYFFRRGSDFCLLDSDFGGWSDRLFRFGKRDCFCFTGVDMELYYFGWRPFSTNRT